jgi:DNA-binding transcriptional LysR family regulator
MQIHELEWFVAVVEDPNLTRVAERLSVSQPALSRSLRRLETTVGAPLLDRVGRTVAPNPQGRLLAGYVRRALGELRAGTDAVRGASDPERGDVRLGFLHTLGEWLVPELVSAFRHDHPAVTLRLRQSPADALLAGLLDGDHELLLVSPEPHEERVVWRALFDEPLALAVPPGHRLAHRRRVSLAEVAGDPFVGFRHGLGLRATVDGLCAAAGFAAEVAFEGDDVATVRGLVEAGLGVAVVPVRAGAHAPASHLALRDPGSARTIGLCWHRDRGRTPAADAFARFVLERAP